METKVSLPKVALPVRGSFEVQVFGLKKNRMAVPKKKVHPVSRVGTSE